MLIHLKSLTSVYVRKCSSLSGKVREPMEIC